MIKQFINNTHIESVYNCWISPYGSVVYEGSNSEEDMICDSFVMETLLD